MLVSPRLAARAGALVLFGATIAWSWVNSSVSPEPSPGAVPESIPHVCQIDSPRIETPRVVTGALAIERGGQVEKGHPVCAVDVHFPLKVELFEDEIIPVRPGTSAAISYRIRAERQFEQVQVELLGSPQVRILSGARDATNLGPLIEGAEQTQTLTAVLSPDADRGTVEIRVTGWTEGKPLQTATVWNLRSESLADQTAGRRAMAETALGHSVREQTARRVDR